MSPPDQGLTARAPQGGRVLPRALLLALAVVALYLQVLGHGFVNYDDPTYVSANPVVAEGLTPEGVRWAFGTKHGANWHPLTWLSHMFDVTLFGLDPGPHHMTSVVFHALNTALLFVLLHALTGAMRPSMLAAALFALHPLRVESVAWIAERKDVLAGTFWIVALLAYVAWVRRGGALRYVSVLACLAAGLMSKPMVVTFPFVLLLLDAWPLGRLSRANLGRRIVEKLPLFALAALSAVMTWFAQSAGGSMRLASTWPLEIRLANAALSYVLYLRDMVWPVRLACFYPHPGTHAGTGFLVAGALAAVGLAGVTVWTIRCRRRHPAATVGWLWFLGTLVPVLGLVQAGAQGRADRYTYLPSIGIAVAVAWAWDRAAGDRRRLFAAALVPLALFAALSWRQTRTWKDSRTLWTHALDATERNAVAHNNLGAVHDRNGDLAAAAEQFEAALAVGPDFPQAHNNLGLLALRRGEAALAAERFEDAIAVWPGYAEAHSNLGAALARQGFSALAREHLARAVELDARQAAAHNLLGWLHQREGRTAEAVRHYGAAIEAAPAFADARVNLGNVLLSRGDLAGAREHYEMALESQPDRPEAHNNLGYVLSRTGDPHGAVRHYRRTVELRPDMVPALDALAWILATHPDGSLRDGAEALRHAGACREAAGPDHVGCLEALAAAHAELGDFVAAAARQSEALALRPDDTGMARRLADYRAGRPARER